MCLYFTYFKFLGGRGWDGCQIHLSCMNLQYYTVDYNVVSMINIYTCVCVPVAYTVEHSSWRRKRISQRGHSLNGACMILQSETGCPFSLGALTSIERYISAVFRNITRGGKKTQWVNMKGWQLDYYFALKSICQGGWMPLAIPTLCTSTFTCIPLGICN